ncbi:hypothetical protein Q4512_00215 [Oceanihabitans sp. 2_MG-2023]|uniref:hypothetical protein n=1 Tax=Oceanihabitans sp. 2_MG-2023 TaxID=3062661 RepID=UPI0026E3F131|nr:hypothetical protein [Oceanihabitans sp. 2_MG-2023]MDO6595314.1 hypothetical protein [Oceanihabitans sp. 2_MG-2023]
MKNSIYNINEKKQAAINELTTQVFDAQYEVEQCQTIVSSLREKASKFQGFLTSSEEIKKQAQNNLLLIEQILAAAKDLESKSNIALSETITANDGIDKMASSMKTVVNKLIYSAEVIKKLHTLIIRNKAKNPLISNELINRIITSEKDATNAVTLALVALTSSSNSQSSIMESNGIANLENQESINLVSNIKAISNSQEDAMNAQSLIYSQLQKAYKKAKEENIKAIKVSQITINQLDEAISNLNKAEVKLHSLQAGLSAANAAYLGS